MYFLRKNWLFEKVASRKKTAFFNSVKISYKVQNSMPNKKRMDLSNAWRDNITGLHFGVKYSEAPSFSLLKEQLKSQLKFNLRKTKI